MRGRISEHQAGGATFRTATGFLTDSETNPLAGGHSILAGLLGVVACRDLAME